METSDCKFLKTVEKFFKHADDLAFHIGPAAIGADFRGNILDHDDLNGHQEEPSMFRIILNEDKAILKSVESPKKCTQIIRLGYNILKWRHFPRNQESGYFVDIVSPYL